MFITQKSALTTWYFVSSFVNVAMSKMLCSTVN